MNKNKQYLAVVLNDYGVTNEIYKGQYVLVSKNVPEYGDVFYDVCELNTNKYISVYFNYRFKILSDIPYNKLTKEQIESLMMVDSI